MTERSARTRRARALRQGQTRAETALWALLRGRRLDGLKFRRQFPIDRYFADFVCVEVKLVVELDGAVHDGSVIYDEGRTKVIEAAGYAVLRFRNDEVFGAPHEVLERIRAAVLLSRP